MIIEGVVDISPQEEKALDSFLKELEVIHNRRAKIHKGQSDMAVCASFKENANDYVAPKYGVDGVFWRFYYEPTSKNMAQYDTIHNEIQVNLAYSVENPKLSLSTQKIKFDNVAQHIHHEWVHFKQNNLYKKATGQTMTAKKLYGKRDYYANPWEQMAFAKGELEWIKRNLKKTKPAEVIKWLKKWGLNQSELVSNLKKTNPVAYKNILKYAILFLLRAQAKQATTTKQKSA